MLRRSLPDESTLSKSMTIVAGSQSGHSKKSSGARNTKSGNAGVVPESESDTSISPSAEFSNMPTYRVPCKSSRSSDGRAVVGAYAARDFGHAIAANACYFTDMFRPDSSTESNNDQGSPALERRLNTPRHIGLPMEKRGAGQRSRKHASQSGNQTLERRKCPGSNNR